MPEAATRPLNTVSLRQQVYERIRGSLQLGEIRSGEVLDLNELSGSLGISRTPLREALIQLEIEGFVEILPRRGCVVRRLTQTDIRELYQLIGAMEAAVIRTEFGRIGLEQIRAMRRGNEEMRGALARDDFDAYYAANLAMHEVYLGLSDNSQIRHLVSIWKQRLYDFPRKRAFVKEWELASCEEHDELIRQLESGDAAAAADYVQNVHWSFEVQQQFIEDYYLEEMAPEDGGE
jgi:DNA-binding GntR family transcriptional regulator